jgi:hypothetical protein
MNNKQDKANNDMPENEMTKPARPDAAAAAKHPAECKERKQEMRCQKNEMTKGVASCFLLSTLSHHLYDFLRTYPFLPT